MNYKYLITFLCLSIMTNQLYGGFSFAKLAERVTDCKDYIGTSCSNVSLERKVAIGVGVGVFGICSALLYRHIKPAHVENLSSQEEADKSNRLAEEQMRLNLYQKEVQRIGWHLVNLNELFSEINSSLPVDGRLSEAS